MAKGPGRLPHESGFIHLSKVVKRGFDAQFVVEANFLVRDDLVRASALQLMVLSGHAPYKYKVSRCRSGRHTANHQGAKMDPLRPTLGLKRRVEFRFTYASLDNETNWQTGRMTHDDTVS